MSDHGWPMGQLVGFVAFIAFAGALLGGVAGYHFGIHEASERFYKNCQGGEIIMSSPSTTETAVVGCAEIARRIR